MTAPEPTKVTDRLGQEILVGSIVAAPHTKSYMFIGRVESISPKTVKLQPLDGTASSSHPPYKYHNQVIVIDAIDETFLFMLGRGL
jgi:hypothetical protein